MDFRGYDVYANGVIGEQLRMVELADLRRMGHYSQSPDALYWLIKISRVSNVLGPWISGSGISREEAEALIPGLDLSPGSRFAPATTKLLWATMQTPLWRKVEARTEAEQLKEAESIAKLIKDFSVREPKEDEDGSRPDHTAGITVIDAEGNMLSLVHSVTSAVWGELGIFVEGVSVVDPGAFAQKQIAKAGPGKVTVLRRKWRRRLPGPRAQGQEGRFWAAETSAQASMSWLPRAWSTCSSTV